MRMMIRTVALAAAAALWTLPAQATTGTLVFDVKPFTSKVKLKEKIENRLKTGGIEWGAADGQLVVTTVNKRFIRFDLPHMTRYGESKTLELAPGTYTIHCAAFIPEGGLSVEKALAKGAFFNLDQMTFEIAEGKTTTLEVHPVIESESTFLLKFFMPELQVKLVEDGAIKQEAVINNRVESSIAWNDYSGPLKFTAE
ncbi:MAG TPA: hypothetical protein VD701_09695 [Steroidobacteraceae bacterium]|nr:hypothetical protein [Steroidobacteraceae bacterium]